MTEKQIFQLLAALGVSKVYKDKERGKIVLEIKTDGTPETLTVSEFKGRHVSAIRELEERKNEVRENRFAAPLEGDLSIGSRKGARMQFLKRDEQLTAEEREEKKRLFREFDEETSRHRVVISVMNHLQVHFEEMIPALETFSGMTAVQSVERVEQKAVWTKGIKSAALFCLRECRGATNEGRTQLDVAREFLSRYAIAGENDYTAEQLSNNIAQVRLLDQFD